MKRHFEENPYADKEWMDIAHHLRRNSSALSDNLHFMDAEPEAVEEDRKYTVKLASSAYTTIAACEAVLASVPKDVRKEAKADAEERVALSADPFIGIINEMLR